ncbi:MAG: PaaI family thioesterase [Alphaproteobacteria bacterium]|nr:PaaI family thioesterase [Alphaproteobacteria bacterium]
MPETLTPPDPNYMRRVADSFARQGAMGHLGAVLSAIAPGAVEIRLPYRAEVAQQHGFFHGGIVATIADSAGGYAGYSMMPADASVLTVEYKINLMAPAQGDELVARGRVVKTGRTLAVCTAEVFAVDGGRETLCAVMQQTLICLHGRPDTPPG